MKKLPLLMYHNILKNTDAPAPFSVKIADFEQQLQYLLKKGYKTIHFKELDQYSKSKERIVILTFDDMTINQLDLAVPLLEKYNMKASFFIPFFYIGKSDEWNNGTEPIMNIEQIKSLPASIELGYHSYLHRPYASLTSKEVEEDFILSKQIIDENQLKVSPILAYPFGNFPRKEPQKSAFFSQLKKHNIQYALRIGNKINAFPFKNNYEINRIDIKGSESMFLFKWKLAFGKLF